MTGSDTDCNKCIEGYTTMPAVLYQDLMTHDRDHTLQVVGKNMQTNLGAYFLQPAGEKVSRSQL